MPDITCRSAGECCEQCKVLMSAGRGAECQKHCRHPIDVPNENPREDLRNVRYSCTAVHYSLGTSTVVLAALLVVSATMILLVVQIV